MFIKSSKRLSYQMSQGPGDFVVAASKLFELAQKRKESGKKIFDFFGGNISRYEEDGLENKIASNHLVQVAKERFDWYAGGVGRQQSQEGVATSALVREDPKGSLKQAISGFLKKYNDVNLSPDQMYLGHGVSNCLLTLHQALLDPGDEVCVIEPSHYVLSYMKHLHMTQSKMVTVSSDLSSNWRPDLEELRSKITDRTKAIVIVNPSNPLGIIYGDKTLKKIVEIAGEFEIPIISDEMYQLITFDGLKAKSIVKVAGDVPVIVLGSMSKFFVKPGWKLGYACFHDPDNKIEELEKAAMYSARLNEYLATPIIVAAVRTFNDSMDYSFKMVKTVQSRRDFINKRLNEVEGITFRKPECTLYGLLKIDEIGEKHSRWSDDYEFGNDIMKEEGLFFCPGSAFGKSAFGYSRTLLYRNLNVYEEAFDRLEKFMKSR